MNSSRSPLRLDLAVHGVFLVLQLSFLIPGGFFQKGTTPPVVYPFWLVLAALTLFRQKESLAVYSSRLIFIPAGLSILLYGFCLINEMTRDLWGFAMVRLFPVAARIVWYQLGLLLIHPLVFPRVWEGVSNAFEYFHKRGYFGRKIVVTGLALGVGLWLLRSHNISPDGYDWLKHSMVPHNWTRYLREPLGTMIYRLTVWSGWECFRWEPVISIALVTILCGLVTTWIMVRIFRRLFPAGPVGISMAFLVSCCGYTQVFAGNIEVYALLLTGLACFLWAGVVYLQGGCPAGMPGVVFGGMFCLHLSAGWWIPAFLALPFLRNAMNSTPRPPFGELLKSLAAFYAVVIPFWLFLLIYGYRGDTQAMWDHFWGDEVMLTGTDRAMFHKLETYLTPDYYIMQLNEYFYMMPAGVLLFLTLLPVIPRARAWHPLQTWFGLLAGFYLVYSIVWRPDRPFPADWDLFSGLTIPAAIVLLQFMNRLDLPPKAKDYILYQCVVFSLLYLFFQLLRNHVHATEWPVLL
ncbi:MAG: hypothetical protein HPY51_03345 [Candidatus Omnitrophica bacterium]|nr:hypothetical protein [Candidatus Omnitrophota bacterium]